MNIQRHAQAADRYFSWFASFALPFERLCERRSFGRDRVVVVEAEGGEIPRLGPFSMNRTESANAVAVSIVDYSHELVRTAKVLQSEVAATRGRTAALTAATRASRQVR